MTEPYYDNGTVRLWLGDCRELTDWLAADVLVTDPPYGIGWEQPAYLAKGRKASERTKQHDGIRNDGDLLVRDSVIGLWGDRPGLVFGAIEQPKPQGTRRVLVWKKPADAGLFGSIIWRKDWEPIYVIGRWPQSPATESAVIPTAAGTHRAYAQGVHPHAKPVDALERLIVKCPPGTVADPFSGSGSTLVAAQNLGRRAIGVELEERYCEVIAKRLEQMPLFAAASEPEPPAEQPDIFGALEATP